MKAEGIALLVTVLLQGAMLLWAWRLGQDRGSKKAGTQGFGAELWRRQIAVSIIFFLASAAAYHWDVVDIYVVAFAVLFVLAQVVHAALLDRGQDALSALALRASVIALAGLVAMVALDVLPGEADTYQVP